MAALCRSKPFRVSAVTSAGTRVPPGPSTKYKTSRGRSGPDKRATRTTCRLLLAAAVALLRRPPPPAASPSSSSEAKRRSRRALKLCSEKMGLGTPSKTESGHSDSNEQRCVSPPPIKKRRRKAFSPVRTQVNLRWWEVLSSG